MSKDVDIVAQIKKALQIYNTDQYLSHHKKCFLIKNIYQLLKLKLLKSLIQRLVKH